MKRSNIGRKGAVVSLALGVAILLASCSSDTATEETTAAAETSAAAESEAPATDAAGNCINDIFGAGGPEAGEGVVINNGMLLAMTGAGSFFGEVMSKGSELAAEQILAAGGPEFKTSIADHKNGDVPTAITETKRLISQDDIVTLQTSYGAPSEAIAPIIAEAGVLTLNGGGSSPGQLSKDFLWQNRMLYAEDPNAGALAWINATYPDAKTIALIGTMENGVGTFNESAPANWAALTGGTVVAAEQHDVGATDFKALASKIKAANPDVIMSFSFGDDVGYQVKALREAGVTVPIIGDEFTQQAAEIAGASYDTFNFATDFYNVDNPNPWNVCYVEAHRAKYGNDPEYYGSNYYEQVFIFWELVKRVIAAGGDPADAGQLQAALVADPSFKSVYGGDEATVGIATFDANDHSISKPMGVFSVVDGKPVLEQEIVKIAPGADPKTALVAK